MATTVLMIRSGLAAIDLSSGKVARALTHFERIAAEARAMGLIVDALCTELRIAECLGRAGLEREMLARVDAIRSTAEASAIVHDPALRELFELAEKRDVSYALVSHVARFLEARERGSRAAYRPFRVAGDGC